MDYNPLDKIENHVHTEANKHINEYVKSFMKSGYDVHGFKVTPHKWPTYSSTLKNTKGQGWGGGKRAPSPTQLKTWSIIF